jgi:hypothetical protein
MSTFLTFSDGVYLQKDVADDLYLSKLDATTGYLSKTEAASTYTTDASVANTYLSKTDAASTYTTNASAANTYLSKTEAASTYTTDASVANTYLSKTEAASTYTTGASVANTYLSKNNPQISSGTLDIRYSNGIQVSSETTISPSTFENWNNLFGLPNVGLTNDGIIFKKQPYYNSSTGYQTGDALVTKNYTDQQIATRGGVSIDNTWTGQNYFSQLPTASGTVGLAGHLVTKAYTDQQIANQIATRGGLNADNTWTGLTNSFQNGNNSNQYFKVEPASSRVESRNMTVRTLDQNGVRAVEALNHNTRFAVCDTNGNLLFRVGNELPDTVQFLQKAKFLDPLNSDQFFSVEPHFTQVVSRNMSIRTLDNDGVTAVAALDGITRFGIRDSNNNFVLRVGNDQQDTVQFSQKILVSGSRVNNYSSNWTYMAANSEYNFSHNFGWTIESPPFLRILFSPVSAPVLGTDIILEMDVCHTTGLDNNQTNEMYGIFVSHLSGNTLRIYTGNDGVYYGKGTTTYHYHTGYIKVIMYK